MTSFMKVVERRCRILGAMLFIATLILSLTLSPALADSDKRVVKVMTQNMDAGTDLLFFFVSRNLEILDVAVVGDITPFPSDHAGVVATLRVEK